MTFVLLLGLAAAASANVRAKSAASAFASAYDNGVRDGHATRDELVRLNLAVNDKYPVEARHSAFASFFDAFDGNGDRRVSCDEFTAATAAPYDAVDDDAFNLQLHLSWPDGVDVSLMRVTWVTFSAKNASLVRFQNATVSRVALATTTTYNVGLLGGWAGWIHTAVLTGLAPAAAYSYAVSADGGATWSATHQFTTRHAHGTFQPSTWAVLGDAGAYFPAGYAVMDGLLADLKQRPYDGVLHVGDLAYATSLVGDTHEIEKFWDYWGEIIAPVASQIPYMISIGNHEDPYNYTSYTHRFQMPQASTRAPDGFWYTMLVSGVLFVQIDTQHGADQLSAVQLAWLTAVLAKGAADPSVHWIVVNGHRPQINSDTTEYSSHEPQSGHLFQQLEPLFRKYGVLLYLCGHQHMFEIAHPVALNGTVTALPVDVNGRQNVYVQPQGTVRVTQGTGGIFTFSESYVTPQPAWSWVRNDEYGFGRLTVLSPTLLQYEFVETSHGNAVNHFFYIQQ